MKNFASHYKSWLTAKWLSASSNTRHVRVYNPYKGKAIPLQAWTGPEGSRTLRLPDFKTIGT